MPRNVQFNDTLIDGAAEVAPTFEFSVFAQSAVREKIDRLKREIELAEKLSAEARDAN